MRHLYLASSLLCAVFTSVSASSNSEALQPLPLKLDFEIHRGSSSQDMTKGKRAGLSKRLLNMEVDNRKSFYLAELQIGSNSNKVGVLVDTGSSDLWVMSHDLRCVRTLSFKRERLLDLPDLEVEGESQKEMGHGKAFQITELIGGGPDSVVPATRTLGPTTNTCTKYGSFATGNSDSFKRNLSAPAFSISYADGSDANGIWGVDNIKIGGTTVKSLSFAVANETSSNVGVLGIGLPGLEVTSSIGSSDFQLDSYTYQNLPLKLKADGIISKNAFSLYLGKESDDLGLILFGAIDTAKYSGDLLTVPMVNSYSAYVKNPIRLEVALSSMTLQSDNQNIHISSNPHAVVLDTGSTYSYVFEDMLSNIAQAVGANYYSSVGAYVLDCINDDSSKISLDFSGAKIDVPLSAIQAPTGQQGTCLLTLLPQSSQSKYVLFGDNILRHMYVVYDLDDYEISFAQVNFTNDEKIVNISSAVPLAKKAPNYSLTKVSTEGDEASATETVALHRGNGQSSGQKKNAASGINVPLILSCMAMGAFILVC